MNIFLSLLIILLSAGFLLFPSAALTNAREGLIYFGLNMVPALFPFMVLANLALEMDLTRRISPIIHPLTHFLFHSDYEEDFCILTGLLCGFPMGAITLSSQIKNGKISPNRGRKLLSFICLPGPIYIASLLLPLLSSPAAKALFLCLFYGIPFLMGVLLCSIPDFGKSSTAPFRYPISSTPSNTHLRYPVSSTPSNTHLRQTHDTAKLSIVTKKSSEYSNENPYKTAPDFPTAFQKALNRSLQTILSLGGIVILFYTLRLFLALLPKDSLPLSILTSFLLEINGGIAALTNSRTLLSQRELLLYLSLFPLCGFSCLIQVLTVIKDTGLRLVDYLIPRVLHCLIFFLLAFVLTMIFPNCF